MHAEQPDLQAETVPLSKVLSRVCEQLRESETAIEELEELISDLLMTHGGQISGVVPKLQNLDLIRQQISGLGDFLDVLRLDLHEHWAVDITSACSAVRLAKLAERLADCSSEPAHTAEAEDDLELFHPAPEPTPLRRTRTG